jgi:AraC family transcriptional regulator
MVCSRCKMVVREELLKFGVNPQSVELGEVEIREELNNEKKNQLNKILQSVGFQLIDNHLSGLIEKIKTHVIKKARNNVNEKDNKINLSNYLSDKLHHEYTYLSSLFSSVEGRTIENFYIEQRIEKAKELIIYGQMTLSEIAYELEYSSVAHLSSQFKKITGLTPSFFKQVGTSKRKPLDLI